MTRINATASGLGQVAFPVRGWFPQVGETWLVEVSHQNEAETVSFLAPVKQIDTEQEARYLSFKSLLGNQFGHRRCHVGGLDCPLAVAIRAEARLLASQDIEITLISSHANAVWLDNQAFAEALERVEVEARRGGYVYLQDEVLDWSSVLNRRPRWDWAPQYF